MKKIWQENKVLFVLGIMIIICLIIFSAVAIYYFYGGSDSPYGNRLDVTENNPLSEKLLKDIKEELEKNEIVKSATIDFQNLIVYVSIEFNDGTKMEDAKMIAVSSLELFNKDELSIYDIDYTITSLSTSEVVGYTLKGARNANGSGSLVWGNYNIKESSES